MTQRKYAVVEVPMCPAYFLCVIGFFPGAPPSIDAVVAAHEAVVGRIEKFDLVIDIRQIKRDGKILSPPVEICRARWSHEDSRDRTRVKRVSPEDLSKVPSARPS